MVEPGLSGKVAVVTGASQGIGLAVVEALVEGGARVVAAARHSSERLDELVDHEHVSWVPVDLSDHRAAADVVAAAGERIDVVVNNLGTSSPRPGGFLSVSDADWRSTLELNLLSAVRMVRAALPRIPEGGAIVTITSDNARLPDPGIVDYSAAKAALANLTKALSIELAPRRIRVNAVSPGPVETRRWPTPEQRRQAAARTATGRLTTPAEVAAAVAMLAGDRSGNTTGSSWAVDGGLLPVV